MPLKFMFSLYFSAPIYEMYGAPYRIHRLLYCFSLGTEYVRGVQCRAVADIKHSKDQYYCWTLDPLPQTLLSFIGLFRVCM